jgi:hypothetical protein
LLKRVFFRKISEGAHEKRAKALHGGRGGFHPMTNISSDNIKRVFRAAEEKFPGKKLEDYTGKDFQELADFLLGLGDKSKFGILPGD